MDKKEQIKEEVEKIRPYLLNQGLDLEQKHEKDGISYKFAKRGNLRYLLLNIKRFDKKLRPGDKGYPAQAEGTTVNSYYDEDRRAVVFTKEGKIIIDQPVTVDSSIDSGIYYSYIESYSYKVFLDENNLLLPTTGTNFYDDIYQHFRIEDEVATLIHTFNEPAPESNGRFTHCPRCYDELVNNKLIRHNHRLYNFSKGEFLNHPKFDLILIPNEWELGECLRKCFWDMDIDEENLCKFVKDEMEKGNVMFGYKEINVEKKDIIRGYRTFAYLDKDANILSNLFYSDGSELKMMKVSNETYDDAINTLTNDLLGQIDKELERRTPQEKVYQKLKIKKDE